MESPLRAGEATRFTPVPPTVRPQTPGSLQPAAPQRYEPAPGVSPSVPMARATYYVTGFSAGFCMMGLEILAGPLLEPAFGEGKDVWAGIISVFILSLSIGYSLGGWVADRFDTRRSLGVVLLLAGILYCTMPLYAWTLIDALHASILELRAGALIASMLLFFLPSVLVGMVTPMLVKLMFQGIKELGRTTGLIYSVAAVGNVVGVLFTNFILVDVFGLSSSLVGMGLVLTLIGAWLARR